MKEVKAIILDIGGVLFINKNELKKRKIIHRNLGVHQEIAKRLKISLDQYFDSIGSAYAKSLKGKITKSDLLTILYKKLNVSRKILEKFYYNAYKKYVKKNKSLISKLINLKKQGYKLAILSDQWHLSKKAHLAKEFPKLFKPIILSCDVGARKPNIKIYKLVLKKLKVPAKNCLFIDNQEWNIKPAKKLGMKTILFKNNKQLFKEFDKILK